MKIALVHELLTTKGGAEHVLNVLAMAYPQANVYTLLAKPEVVEQYNLQNRLKKSSLQTKIESIPLLGKLLPLNHHLWLPWLSSAAKQWDFSDYDVVISSSSAFAHHIQVTPPVKHICYVHSPARYLWDRTHDVQKRMNPLKRWYFSTLAHKLRQQDVLIEHKNCSLLAASQEVRRRIELYWREESTVVYPPLADHWLEARQHTTPPTNDYFLVVSTLAPYKRIELAIEACNQLNVPLKIAGSGSAESRLKQLAGPTVKFLGHVPNTELPDLYYNAKAVLFVGEEDFGLVPLEAMSQGTPAVGYAKGGALETITLGITGELFTEPTAASLASVLQNFDQKMYSIDECKATAQMFSVEKFLRKIQSLVVGH